MDQVVEEDVGWGICKIKLPGSWALGQFRRRGGDLLSHFRSTIGVVRFNFSVRNGKRWSPHAIDHLSSLSVPARLWGGLTGCKVKKSGN